MEDKLLYIVHADSDDVSDVFFCLFQKMFFNFFAYFIHGYCFMVTVDVFANMFKCLKAESNIYILFMLQLTTIHITRRLLTRRFLFFCVSHGD